MAASFTPLKRAPAYQRVYDAIEAEIVSGKLADGDILPTETDLAHQFDVHRSTVREGMRLLEQAGLIARGPAKRMVVALPGTEDAARRASKGLALHGVTFLEVWEALSLFQPQAAAMAAERMDAGSLAKLEETVSAIETASSQGEIVDGAFNFFEVITASTGNSVIEVSLQSLNILVASSLAKVIGQLPEAGKRITEAQRKLIAAFETKDADKARRWMKRHIDDLRRGYEVVGEDLGIKVL